MLLTHCIECGCHDEAACYDENAGRPCAWIVVDRAAGKGVCSACPDALARWTAGDRAFAVPVSPAADHGRVEELQSMHGEPVVRTPVELFAHIREGESLVVQQGLGTGKSVYAMQETDKSEWTE